MVKKSASIFFLSIFLFNWFGYRLLYSLLEEKANSALIASLDNDQYNDNDLITVKLPSHLPYYTNSDHFNRMDGEIELNGKHYNFVKCRVYKDSIEYLCIPNKARTNLSNARDEFYKLVNDLQHPSQSKKSGNSGSIKSLLSEYYNENNSWSFFSYSPDISIISSFYIFSFSKPLLLPRELPPDAC
jgi:hypothetical protein